MRVVNHIKFRDRENAGHLLANKLEAYRDTDAIIAGIPPGGVRVGAAIAETLSLQYSVLPCRKIKHPIYERRTIGSVSADEVVLGHCPRTIPQDYIYHQIALLRNALQHDRRRYGDKISTSFLNKTVILVDDILLSGDSILACIRSVRKQRPLKIVIATPVVSADALPIVEPEADDIVYLEKDTFIRSPQDYFSELSPAFLSLRRN